MEHFNKVSETEESELVKVYLRLKPCIPKSTLYEVKSDRCLITSVGTATAGHGRGTQNKMCTFSHIFGPESSQKDIFEHVVKKNLRKLPAGHNFTLMTYGASGSGKTYTLMGTVSAPGLVPRSLEYVFGVVDAAQRPVYKPELGGIDKLDQHKQDYELQRVKSIAVPSGNKYRRMSVHLPSNDDTTDSAVDKGTRYYIWVSFVEIYNDNIYDVLKSRKSSLKLSIREDANGHAYVKGATYAFVRSGQEAYDVMVAGKLNLKVAATGVHGMSSRSHCIFTITMIAENEDGVVRSSCVRLCDLAGSERAEQTGNTGARMQESRAINSSLHVLERCLHMLRQKRKQSGDLTLVPYRESKVTHLLCAGLSRERDEALAMMVTVNPAPEFANVSRHVLQLAAVARDIQVNNTAEPQASSSQGRTEDYSSEIMKLRAKNEDLQLKATQADKCISQLKKKIDDDWHENSRSLQEVIEEVRDMMVLMEFVQTENDELRAANIFLQKELSQERRAHARTKEILQQQLMEEKDEISEEECIEICSESDEDDSLEPTFRRRTSNKTRLSQQSTCDSTEATSDVEELNNSDQEASADRIKTTVRLLGEISEEECIEICSESDEDDSLEPTFRRRTSNKTRLSQQSTCDSTEATSDVEELNNSDQEASADRIKTTVRLLGEISEPTSDVQELNNSDQEASADRIKTPVRLLGGTYFVRAVNELDDFEQGFITTNIECKDYAVEVKSPVKETTDDILDKSVDTTIHEKDVSLARFEPQEKGDI